MAMLCISFECQLSQGFLLIGVGNVHVLVEGDVFVEGKCCHVAAYHGISTVNDRFCCGDCSFFSVHMLISASQASVFLHWN